MLVRVLSSVCALVTAGAGVLLMDCEWNLLAVDSMGVCATVASLGLSQTAYVGVGLGVFAFLALIAIWLPKSGSDDEKSQIDREESFYRNIERISGPAGTLEPVAPDDEAVTESADLEAVAPEPAPVESAPRTAQRSLTDRLEALEIAMTAEGAKPTREETEQWMRLLRQANDLHNRGELATDDFREINTRLLDLFVEPALV